MEQRDLNQILREPNTVMRLKLLVDKILPPATRVVYNDVRRGGEDHCPFYQSTITILNKSYKGPVVRGPKKLARQAAAQIACDKLYLEATCTVEHQFAETEADLHRYSFQQDPIRKKEEDELFRKAMSLFAKKEREQTENGEALLQELVKDRDIVYQIRISSKGWTRARILVGGTEYALKQEATKEMAVKCAARMAYRRLLSEQQPIKVEPDSDSSFSEWVEI